MRILREPLFGAKRYSAFSVVTLSVFAETTLSKDGLPPLKAQSGRFLRQMSGTAVIFASYFCMRRFYFVIYVLQEDK